MVKVTFARVVGLVRAAAVDEVFSDLDSAFIKAAFSDSDWNLKLSADLCEQLFSALTSSA